MPEQRTRRSDAFIMPDPLYDSRGLKTRMSQVTLAIEQVLVSGIFDAEEKKSDSDKGRTQSVVDAISRLHDAASDLTHHIDAIDPRGRGWQGLEESHSSDASTLRTMLEKMEIIFETQVIDGIRTTKDSGGLQSSTSQLRLRSIMKMGNSILDNITSSIEEIRPRLVAEGTRGLDRPGSLGRPRELIVFSIDGGGVRALSSLLVLEALMDQVVNTMGLNGLQVPHRIRPCDVADYMFGSCSGGLAAIMVARLRMDIKDCIKVFVEYSPAIFSPTLRAFGGGLLWSKYSSSHLERAIRRATNAYYPLEEKERWDKSPFMTSEGHCRCVVTAMRLNQEDKASEQKQYLLRSYIPLPEELELEDWKTSEDAQVSLKYCSIRELALATSAAPTLFPPARIGSNRFLNNGPGANNPIGVAINEISEVHPKDPLCMVSFGSSAVQSVKRPTRAGHAIRDPIRALEHDIETIETYDTLRSLVDSTEIFCCRFDSKLGRHISPDQLKLRTSSGGISTLDSIREQVEIYLEDRQTQSSLKHCAERIVASYAARHRLSSTKD